MRPLVIVRPQPGAGATAAAAESLGLEAIVMPLFEVRPVEWTAPDPAGFDALLLSSANALRHGGSQLGRLRTLPAHCVGEATATAAREAGLSVASVGTGGADSLLGAIPDDHRLLHLCGADRREPNEARQPTEALVVYAAVELPAPRDLERAEGAVVAVHSPRAAATFSKRADEAGLRRATIAIAAISDAAASSAGDGWQSVESAPEPSDRALLALAAELCNKPR